MAYWLAHKKRTGEIDQTFLCTSEEERQLLKTKDRALIEITAEEYKAWKQAKMEKEHRGNAH